LIPLVATVIPLGLAAAIKPALFCLQLLIVGTPNWPRRAVAVVIGAAIPMIIWTAFGLTGFAHIPDSSGILNGALGLSLRLIIGLAFLGASVWFWFPHPVLLDRTRHFLESHIADGRPRTMLMLALIIQGKSLTLYALLLPALHDISIAPTGIVNRGAALAALFILALSVVWVPILLGVIFARRPHDPLPGLYTFVMQHQFTLLAIMALVVGLYLTASAAWIFMSG
jgi:hypothetical protein